MFLFALAFALQTTPPGEDPVDPYPQSNINAGAVPFKGDGHCQTNEAFAIKLE